MLRDILQKHNFSFNKALGQNFISDKNLLEGIVRDSGITAEDTVVEIGAGGGTLTRALCEKAGRVHAFEIDNRLQPILEEMLSGYKNFELHFADVLKIKDDAISEIVKGEFKLVANLPYYITTPLLMRFIESGLPVKSLTLMMQKEVADRLCARENTPEYGAVTLAVKLWGGAKITRMVDKKAFFPVPKVDSAVVRIDMNDRYGCRGDEKLHRLIRAAFAMRRKTLLNNIIAAFSMSREQAASAIESAGFDTRIRGEVLSVEDFIKISNII